VFDPDRKMAGVFNMATHPDARGRGLAGALLVAMAAWPGSRGAEGLYLQVDERNQAAQRAYAHRARLNGLNVVGLKRRGMTRSDLKSLREAYRSLFERGTPAFWDRVDEVADSHGHVEAVAHIIDFIRADSSRALCHPQSDHAG
jgi:hypothetical protein